MEEQKKAVSEFAIASLAVGIFSLVTVFGLEKAIIAIVLGILALRRLGRNAELKGKGLAWAGISLGVISVVLIIILAVKYIPQVIQMQQQQQQSQQQPETTK